MHMFATNAPNPTTQEYAVSPEPAQISYHNRIEFNPLSKNIYSYVNIKLFSLLLCSHPNRILVQYVLQGLKYGFDIGFKGVSHITRPKNLLSATENEVELDNAILKEVTRGHTSGPFINPPFNNLHCSPIGAVVKKRQNLQVDHGPLTTSRFFSK